MLKARTALAAGHSFNQLGHVGVVTPSPSSPTSQARMCSTSEDVEKHVQLRAVEVRMWTYVLIKLLAKHTLEAFKAEYLLKLIKS